MKIVVDRPADPDVTITMKLSEAKQLRDIVGSSYPTRSNTQLAIKVLNLFYSVGIVEEHK